MEAADRFFHFGSSEVSKNNCDKSGDPMVPGQSWRAALASSGMSSFKSSTA